MPLKIVRDNIIKLRVDAIVNAANSRLQQGGGVCGAIFSAAGADKLQAECDRIGHCDVGRAVITDGYALPARYIIHTAGPVWHGGGAGEEELLASCYNSSLTLAHERGLESIAFPLISSGIFGYPRDKALHVAITSIGDFLLQHDMTVYLVIFDNSLVHSLSDRLFSSISEYIDENHVRDISQVPDLPKKGRFIEHGKLKLAQPSFCLGYGVHQQLAEAAISPGENFTEMLFRLIDESGMSDVDVYKRANLDRKLFSKIRCNPGYRPSKSTALALAVALELDAEETADLLRRAGFALSPCSRFDLIVKYFINDSNYNIFEINEALFAFGEDLLGA